MRHYLDLAPEVAAALAAGRPVVALESTLIAHGLPRPQNLEVARSVEAAVRQGGAVPATVAVLDGRLRVGCSAADLERLAGDTGLAKASLRDLPILLAGGGSGATTVAATATIAAAAGIAVFATGGIGGVHRAPGGGRQTWDISADLTVLGREPVAVVCAGAKSVLDIGATLEVLETLGVTVVGYQTDRFPGFYVRETAFGVDCRADSPEAAARIIWARRRAGLSGAVLLVNPVPAGAALDPGALEAVIQGALARADAQGIGGRDLTPFLLARLREATGGASLAANTALIHANAALGARVACALTRLAAAAAEP